MKRAEIFLKHLEASNLAYSRSIRKNYDANAALFEGLSEDMLRWAETLLGERYLTVLESGYVHFVNDVNRSQFQYEKDRKYKNKTYAEVYAGVYDNAEYMEQYHWGVFTTTFAWEHHLKIHKYFEDYFVGYLGESGAVLDLGSGSGIWSLLLLRSKKNWRSTGIDISSYSANKAGQLAEVAGLSQKVSFVVGDALKYTGLEKADAAISCFVLEHLEEPEKLFRNVGENLKDGGYAFMSTALTAAEIDHIYEFRRESELVTMAEKCGFRVVSMLSESPKAHPRSSYFLPRSMAMVLRKKGNPIW